MNQVMLREADCSLVQSISLTGLESIAAHDSHYGKMYLVPSVQTKAEILQAWLVSWRVSMMSIPPQTAGEKKALRWAKMDCSNGAYLTRNGSDWRNGGSACSLSSILETGPIDRRYFLSQSACAGILRRAEKRGKQLPAALKQALMNTARDAITWSTEIAPTLNAHGGYFDNPTYGIPGNWIGRKPENGGNQVEPFYDLAPCLTKMDRHAVAHAFKVRGGCEGGGKGYLGSDDVAFTLSTHQDQHIAVAYAFDSLSSNSMKSSNPISGCNLVEISKTIGTHGVNPSCNQGGNVILQPVVFRTNAAGQVMNQGEISATLNTFTDPCAQILFKEMQVRRLTPIECERLQGFPDNWTKINAKTPDTARYKALGNSMAVPVMHWIGKQIDRVTGKNTLRNNIQGRKQFTELFNLNINQ